MSALPSPVALGLVTVPQDLSLGVTSGKVTKHIPLKATEVKGKAGRFWWTLTTSRYGVRAPAITPDLPTSVTLDGTTYALESTTVEDKDEQGNVTNTRKRAQVITSVTVEGQDKLLECKFTETSTPGQWSVIAKVRGSNEGAGVKDIWS